LEERAREDLPGPADYDSERAIKLIKEKHIIGKMSLPFASNIDRFKDKAPLAPGPGRY
jgi:hypothetical protein